MVVVCALVHLAGQAAAQSQAAIQIVSQSETSLSINVKDRDGMVLPMQFARGSSDELWKTVAPSGTVIGIVFGNPEPKFAGPAARAQLGVSVMDSLRTFDVDIALSPMDDVTVYRLYAGDMAIALWQNNLIVEIWYVGSIVKGLMDLGPIHETMCYAACDMCCATTPGEELQEQPINIPSGNVNSCALVAANCPGLQGEACTCLQAMCLLCRPENAENFTCTSEQQTMSDEACNAGVAHCAPPPPPPPPPWVDKIIDLLDEILDQLQEWPDSLP